MSVNPLLNMTEEEAQKNPTKAALMAIIAIADELKMLAGDARYAGTIDPTLAAKAEITAKHFEKLSEGIYMSIELMAMAALERKLVGVGADTTTKEVVKSTAVLVPGSKTLN